jgi:hypothetical protein
VLGFTVVAGGPCRERSNCSYHLAVSPWAFRAVGVVVFGVVSAFGVVADGAPAVLAPRPLLQALLTAPFDLSELPSDYDGCAVTHGGGVPGLARQPIPLGGTGIVAFGHGVGSGELFYVVYPTSADARFSVEHPGLGGEPVTARAVHLRVVARKVAGFPALPGLRLAGTNKFNRTTITVASVADGPVLTVAWTTNSAMTHTVPGPLLASAVAHLRRVDQSIPRSQTGTTPRSRIPCG